MLRPHIVILGAGFGGVYVAKRLAPYVRNGLIDITIVNKTNYFLFTPLLHEVATGGLSTNNTAESIREIFRGTGIEMCQGKIEEVDLENQRVLVNGCTIAYDYLVVATGAESNYYGIPGADRLTFPIKTLADAVHIRDRVIDAFEKAIFEEDPVERNRLLSFVIVGGGATGVEVAAELAQFIDEMVERYYSKTNRCHPEESAIGLIHMGSELLEQFKPSLRKAAEKRLRENGVEIHLNCSVTEVTKAGVSLSNGSTVAAATVIWTAGVKPNIPHFKNELPSMVSGRLRVDEYFRLSGHERVFALGDVAGYAEGETLLPMLAQVAEAESKIVAKNILASIRGKKLRTLKYRSKGTLVSVGQWFAIGELFSLNLAGKFTWWLWRMVYLTKFASWRKRIRIAFEWVMDLFYPRDITKLS